jgi:hypothetical protein
MELSMSAKEQLITGLVDARRDILESVSLLPPEKRVEVFLGSWSTKDIIAHLIGWDFTNIEAIEDIRQGRVPSVFEKWNPDWAKYNSELVQKYIRDDFTDLLADVEGSQQALIEHLQTLPDEDIQKDFGVRSSRGANITVASYLEFEIEDEIEHHRQIQEWLS